MSSAHSIFRLFDLPLSEVSRLSIDWCCRHGYSWGGRWVADQCVIPRPPSPDIPLKLVSARLAYVCLSQTALVPHRCVFRVCTSERRLALGLDVLKHFKVPPSSMGHIMVVCTRHPSNCRPFNPL